MATTLAETITPAKAAVPVASSSGIVAGDAIQIDSEKMVVTSVEGNTLLCSRGRGGTTPAAHASGATVTEVTAIVEGPVSEGGGSSIPSSQIKVGGGNAITSITLDIAPADGSFIIVGLTLSSGSGGATVSSDNTTWTKVRSGAVSGVDNELWVGAVGTGGGKVITITRSYSFCSGTAIEIGSGMDPASLGVGLSSATISNTLSGVTAGNVVLIMTCNSNTTLVTQVTSLDPQGFGYYGAPAISGGGGVAVLAVTADDTDVVLTATGGNVLLMQELAAA